MAWIYFFKLVVLLQVVVKISGFLDFTCFNANPRININGDDSHNIGGYPSGDDKDVSISFTRRSFTSTGNGLPTDSYETSHSNGVRRLNMPDSGGKERIGAYNCVAEKGGETEIITTITMAENSEITPQYISQTVSIGESVTLAVTTELTGVAWWHNNVLYNGNGGTPRWNDQTSITIPSVTVNNAGIYECNGHNRRSPGIHAIFQLIVRECTSGRWGDQCQFYCPTCYNGGICDERSGQCVCAPGFSGTNCLTIHGYNHWGQDGQLVCSSRNDDACRGYLFCLPHPYGCSCGAGYRGIDCDQNCEAGSYGASCRSTCHCADGISCSPDTGECDGGQCHPDWYGDNCQVPCPAPQLTVSNMRVTPTDNTLDVMWDLIATPCPHAISYKLQYKLTNLDQCSPRANEPIQSVNTPTSQLTIDSLHFYSTYTVYVTAVYIGQPMREGDTVETSQTTGQTVPDFTPTVVSASASTGSNSLTFVWDTVPCGVRRGGGLQYRYQLRIGGKIERDEVTTSTAETLSNLPACTDYTFRVRASNVVGAGFWSQSTYVTTRTIIPGKITELTMVSVLPSEIRLSWQASSDNPCRDTGYNVTHTLLNKDQCDVAEETPDGSSTKTIFVTSLLSTLSGLLPHSTYNIAVTAVNEAGPAESINQEVTTDILRPTSAPSNVIAYDVTSNDISIQWSPPPCGSRNGPIVSYAYALSNGGSQVITDSTEIENVTFRALNPFTNYAFEIAAVTGAGEGSSYTLRVSTNEAVPSAPQNFQITAVKKKTIEASWEAPKNPNGVITEYTVQAAVIERVYDSTFTPSTLNPLYAVNTKVDATQRTYTFTNLNPSTKYELIVLASSGKGNGDPAIIQQFTDAVTREDIPSPPSLADVIDRAKTETTVTLSIPQSTSEFVSGYLVGVARTSNQRKRQVDDFDHYNISPMKYVAAELSKAEVTDKSTFVVGDNKTYGSYYNPPLQEGHRYRLYTAYVSRINNTESVIAWSEGTAVVPRMRASEGTFIVVVIIAVVVITIMAIVITGLVLKMRSQKKDEITTTPKSLTSTDKGKGDIAGTSGQIQLSSDGYVEYNVRQDEATYQDISDSRDSQQQSKATDASGQIRVQYKNDVVHKDEDGYQGITKPTPAQDNDAYVNDSVMRSKQRQTDNDDEDEYEVL